MYEDQLKLTKKLNQNYVSAINNMFKQKINNEQIQPSTNWMRIIMIVGGLIAVYFIFKKVSGKKVEMPKVEVPKA